MPNIFVSSLFLNLETCPSDKPFYLSYENSENVWKYKIISKDKQLLERIADYFKAPALKHQIYDPNNQTSFKPENKLRNTPVMYIDEDMLQFIIERKLGLNFSVEDLKKELLQNQERSLVGRIAYNSEAMVTIAPKRDIGHIEDQLPKFYYFKTIYNYVYDRQLFKNPASRMKKDLDHGDITSIQEVYLYSQRNPNSRSAKVMGCLQRAKYKVDQGHLPGIDDFISRYNQDYKNSFFTNPFSTMKKMIKQSRDAGTDHAGLSIEDVIIYCELHPKSRSARVLAQMMSEQEHNKQRSLSFH